jgi:protein subunit release factor A
MKKIIIIAVLVLACGTLLLAEDNNSQEMEKDLCALYTRNCSEQAQSIQVKIERLNHEIKKSTRVYTSNELKILKNRLRDAEETLDMLLLPTPTTVR